MDTPQKPSTFLRPKFSILIIFVLFSLAVVFMPLLSYVSESTAVYAAITALSAALFAFVFISVRSPVCLVMPVAAYVCAALISHSPLSALTAVAFFPPAFVLSRRIAFPPVCESSKPSRMSIIITMSATIIAEYAVFAVISVAADYGGLGADQISNFVNDQTAILRSILGSLTVEQNDSVIRLYSEKNIDYMINYMIVCIPAVMICISNVLSYFISAFFYLLCRIFRVCECFLGGSWSFSVSRVSAFVYAGAYVLAVLGTGVSSNTITAVATNIIIILTPAFALCGIYGLIRRSRMRRGRGIGVIYMLLCATMLFVNVLTLITLLSFLGVIDTLAASSHIRGAGGTDTNIN